MTALIRVLVIVALGALVAPSVARADAQADKAKAVALFDDGIKNMKAGNYDKACKALAASLALLADSGTRGSLARCYALQGKIASSWLMWRELADTAPSSDLRGDAAAQAKKLEPRLSKYVVKVGKATPGLAVTLDGRPIDPSLDVPAPIDAGKYRVEASASGYVTWKSDVMIAEGKLLTIEVPALEAVAVKPPPEDKDKDKAKKEVVVKSGRGRKIAGIVVGVVGLGGLGAGGFFGNQARTLFADAKELCGGMIDNCPQGQIDGAQTKVDDARKAALYSTIAAAAGGALVVTGIILIATAPKTEKRTVTVAPMVSGDSAGIALGGRF